MFAVPERDGLRVDTHCQAGTAVPPYYDSLLAKLIGHGSDREQAIDLLIEALEDLDVDGVETNRTLLIGVLGHPDFRAGPVTTDWLEERCGAMARTIEFVDTTTRDGNQSLWSATGLTTPDVLAIAPDARPRRIPRPGLHLQHAHGRLGALSPGGSLGADPAGVARRCPRRRWG